MGKAKAWKYNKDKVAKQQLHGVKGSSIKKNKEPKFKNTPTGKVALINNSKTQEIHRPSQKDSIIVKNHNQNVHQKQASKSNTKQAFKSDAKQASKNNTKQSSPNKKQSLPSKAQKLHKMKIPSNSKKTEKQLDGSDLNEEIISLKDDSLNKTNETFEEDSDMDVPDIFGKSLGDESDEDDEDFKEKEEEDDDDSDEEEEEEDDDDDDDDDDSDEEMIEPKNINTFKGLQSKIKKNDKKEEKEDDDKDESDENTTLDESDEDDEDDTDEEDEDEDEEEDGKNRKQVKNIKNLHAVNFPMTMETSDDADDDEDDDEDNDDDNIDTELGLRALLGKNIADDDDDEDFNEEDEDEDEDDEDEDISSEDEDDEENDNAVTKEKTVTKEITDEIKRVKEDALAVETLLRHLLKRRNEMNRKVVLLDNLPKEITEEEIRKVFGQFGSIKTIQLKVFPEMIGFVKPELIPSVPDKIRLKESYPNLTTIMGNIFYKTQESALEAERTMHGKIFKGNYLSVLNGCDSQNIYKDTSKIIFFTNLKEGTEYNEIWKTFRKCGNVMYVRPTRDKRTGLNKGYGFLYFDTEHALQSALKLDGTKIMGRPIKLLPFNMCAHTPINEMHKIDVKQGTKRVISHKKNEPSKKFKKWNTPILCDEDYEEYFKKCKKEREQRDNKEKESDFQGQKVDLKNKKKKNKLDKKKKRMAEKLTAKSAKSAKV